MGQWRFPDGSACSTAAKEGIVTVQGGFLIFEWHFGHDRPNIAVERIDKITDNAIYTIVQSDSNTPSPEVGQRVRYTVQPDLWTSENLSTHRVNTHKRC